MDDQLLPNSSKKRRMKVTGLTPLWTLLSLLCGHLANAADHEDVVKHAIKLHRGKGAVITQRKQWVMESCRKLSGLLRQKNVVLNKLKSAIRAVEKDAGLSDEEKLFQVHTFEIFQKELNESENSVFQAIHGLQRALQGDYKDVVNMKESSRQRLEALREAAIKVSAFSLLFLPTLCLFLEYYFNFIMILFQSVLMKKSGST